MTVLRLPSQCDQEFLPENFFLRAVETQGEAVLEAEGCTVRFPGGTGGRLW